jgi:paraquat-inducible protein B
MNKRANPAVIGGFVVGAVALAILGVVAFGSGRYFRQAHPYVLYFDSDVNGLKVGAPVKFRGVEIGTVTAVLLNVSSMQRAANEFRIPVLIELDQELLREHGAHAHLEDPETLKLMVEKFGMRGQLAMESFVTGLLYVKLDLQPDTPVRYVREEGVPYDEIPTVPTPLEEVQMKASQFFAKLNEIDLAGMARSLDSALESIDKLVSSPKLQTVLDNLDTTLVSFREAAASLQRVAGGIDQNFDTLSASLAQTATAATASLQEARVRMVDIGASLESDAPVMVQLQRSLEEVAGAARSVRSLAAYLERNPGALVRGKSSSEEEQP